MATLNNYKVEFAANGFVPGVDISDAYWTKAVSETVLLQDIFSSMCNKVIDKINETWHKYESIREKDRIMGLRFFTQQCQEAMEIDDSTTYVDWTERYFKDICETVDEIAAMSNYIVRSNLFRDGDLLVFGTKFRNKPEWKIDLRLRQVEN